MQGQKLQDKEFNSLMYRDNSCWTSNSIGGWTGRPAALGEIWLIGQSTGTAGEGRGMTDVRC